MKVMMRRMARPTKIVGMFLDIAHFQSHRLKTGATGADELFPEQDGAAPSRALYSFALVSIAFTSDASVSSANGGLRSTS